MIKHYFKITFRVMLRQKFYTAVSIFGISVTIMIVSITAGVFNLVFGNIPPVTNRSRLLYYNGYSSQLSNGGRSYTAPGPNFLREVRKLPEIEELSLFTEGTIGAFVKGNKISMRTAFTDEKIWNIYNYEILEGRPFNAADILSNQSVAVIKESVKRFYFGDSSAVGKFLDTTPRVRVIGVVKDFVNFQENGTGSESADIILPLSLNDNNTYSAVILARSRSAFSKIKQEIINILNERYNPSKGSLSVSLEDMFEKWRFDQMVAFLSGFIFFVMVIPALNMVGLNINRISERSSEIGIRKSFGATSSTLAGQFIVEGLIISILGGAIGVILTYTASDMVIAALSYKDDIVPSGFVLINWHLISYAFVATIILGLLSGALPAWRMSRLNAVRALKEDSL